ncbi:hypothetical protein PR202_ga10257 [Eleusine coracana subsp. coracana]|uniref:aldehyde oxygenase (deformylating) n=1 Tax=Eleusine coracana subsp. coracana TaxID=191504 RepID=A0AAV5C690_ELECO|nr:hypothetical protein PR202_ga10257 [Eleusine coracana subsp. coracana]
MAWFLEAEELVVTLAPVVVYWVYSGMYEVLLRRTTVLDKYRLHSTRDEETKNIASRKDVVKGVLLQQAIQVTISVAVLKAIESGPDANHSGVVPAAALVNAARTCTGGSTRGTTVAAPYAFAAQYGHPVDAVLTETLSGAAAYVASGMSPRTAAAFFVFATVKGVDDHCGVAAPWNPLHALFANNTAYHDVHHQRGGGRRNFSQPFFVVWDRVLGTHAAHDVVQRPGDGAGLEVRVVNKDQN